MLTKRLAGKRKAREISSIREKKRTKEDGLRRSSRVAKRKAEKSSSPHASKRAKLDPKSTDPDLLRAYKNIAGNLNGQISAIQTAVDQHSKIKKRDSRQAMTVKCASTMINDLSTLYQGSGSTNDNRRIKDDSDVRMVYDDVREQVGADLIKVRRIKKPKIDADIYRHALTPLYDEQSSIMCHIATHYMNSSKPEDLALACAYFKEAKALDTYVMQILNPFEELADVISHMSDADKEDSINKMMHTYYNIASTSFDLAVNHGQDKHLKDAKEHCRQILKTINSILDSSIDSPFQKNLALFKQQTWDLLVHVLEAEGKTVANGYDGIEREILREWMILAEAKKYNVDSDLHMVKVYTRLGVLLHDQGLKTHGSKRSLKTKLPAFGPVFTFFKKVEKPINWQSIISDAYKYFRSKELDVSIPSDVMSEIFRSLDKLDKKEPLSGALPLFAANAFEEAKKCNDELKYPSPTTISEIVDGNRGSDSPQQFKSNSELLLHTKFRYVKRTLGSNQEDDIIGVECTHPRVYQYRPKTDQVFVKQCKALAAFCKEHKLSISEEEKPEIAAEKDMAASIDFSLLGHAAYRSTSDIPAFYNLLLWWLDDKYIDTLQAAEDIQDMGGKLSEINTLIDTLRSIFDAPSPIDLQDDDIPIIKIAKHVHGMLWTQKQENPESFNDSSYKEFVDATFETFNAQLEQAKRKTETSVDKQVLTPEQYGTERLKFSGVDSSLKLAFLLDGGHYDEIKDDPFIRDLWALVNWLVSIDNCGDSSENEINREGDPENHVFILYKHILDEKGIKYDNVKAYFDSIQHHPEEVQQAFQLNQSECNETLFKIRQLLSCVPEGKSPSFYKAVKEAVQWTFAQDWSKGTWRYYHKKHSREFELKLFLQAPST